MDTDNPSSNNGTKDADAVLRKFTWSRDESVSVPLIRAVASISNTDPTELPSLYEVVDPDALDALFSHEPNSSPDRPTVTFTFSGYRVQVAPTGKGYILPSDQRRS